jgi:hypothetical protein
MDRIKDLALKSKMTNAIDYSYSLYDLSKEKNHSEIFKEETYRVIVLYVVSCIEALLLYLYKNRQEKIEILEYKNVSILPKIYQSIEDDKSTVVIAIQTKKEIREQGIGLHELVKHFQEIKIMNEDTGKKLLDLNNVRNTHHLNKDRADTCTIKDVDSSFEILNYLLEKVPPFISNK